MINSNEILAPLGVKRGTSLITIVLILMVIVGVAMLGTIPDKIDKGAINLWYFLTMTLLILIPFSVFMFKKNREIKMENIAAEQKSIVIMVIPSNIGLLKKSLNFSDTTSFKNNKFGIKEIYFLKTKGFPLEKVENEIVDFIKAYGIKVKKIILDNIENPREIQMKFENIVESIDSVKHCAVNITPGKSTTSLFLYELAQNHGIEVQYISSKYDKENNPIDGTEKLTKLQYTYL